jgi:hypothetical protein
MALKAANPFYSEINSVSAGFERIFSMFISRMGRLNIEQHCVIVR